MTNDNDSGAPRPAKTTAKKTPTGDYKPGYCRPPKGGQFQPGQSGNPKGRPSKKKLLGGAAIEAAHAKVWIIQNGKRKRVTVFEAGLLRLIDKALNDDRKAQTELLSLNAKYSRMKPDEEDTTEDREPMRIRLIVDGVEQPPPPDRDVAPRTERQRAKQRTEENDRQIFKRVFAQKIPVGAKGKRKGRKMTIETVLWRKLFADMVVAGDIKAAALIRRFLHTANVSDADLRSGLVDEDGVMRFTLDLGRPPGLAADMDWDPIMGPIKKAG